MTHLTVQALVLLISFPWFGAKKQAEPAPVDTLPPPWKPAPELALEDSFLLPRLAPLVPTGPGLQYRQQFDPRKLTIDFVPDSGAVRYATEVDEFQLGRAGRIPVDQYAEYLSQSNFRKLWRATTRQKINSLGQNTPTGQRGGLSFALPSPLPRRVQSLLGPGGPALNVSGSENIRISGQSNWTNQQVGLLGQRRSLFPTLDMQQDLNIRLEGQLSDRIKVNLLQNSANQIPLANRIAINYKGGEDDLIQALDLGNTNLTLPGTQYVSYSGRNEGLFGIKSTARVGPLDWTILASKQEGKSERTSYTGGSAKPQTWTLNDFDYLKGVYFFLADPNLPAQEIPDTSIHIYLDDANYGNDENSIRGRAMVDPNGSFTDTSSVRGSFALLQPGAGQDYEIINTMYSKFHKVIHMLRPVTGNQILAVTYVYRDSGTTAPYTLVGGQDVNLGGGLTERWMKLLRPPQIVLKPDASGQVYDPANPFTVVRELELKNVYQLPGSRIDPTTFQLSIEQGTDEPPHDVLTLPDGTAVPYKEVLGLDNYDESNGQARVPGHDDKVDATQPDVNSRAFVDYDSGTLFFYELRPFAPRIEGADARPFEKELDARLNRRAKLVGGLAQGVNDPNPLIYDKYNVQRNLDSRYYINVDYTAARAGGDISLGRGNILQGSEVVTINGQTLVRDRDYTIDYDLGRITLKRQLGPSDNLNVDYAYAPLFQQAGRTLVGSAFSLQGRDKSFGGAFMYESQGAQDLRPRLGEEPSRSIIGDLNTDWTFHPDWMTRLVDRLPGVRTTTPSDFRVQAEMGLSIPNPNTKNEIYIDDMEGVRDAVSLSMGIEHWRYPSVPPLKTPAGTTVPASDSLDFAEIHWYSPPSYFHERDLKPALTDAEGGNNVRQVLALSVPRRPAAAAPGQPLWTGLVYSLDPVGIDLSRAQFIEVWVNDFNDQHRGAGITEPRVRGRHLKLHIDLGAVSEDQQRAPDEPPNGLLDTEDKEPRDNQLTVTAGDNEDTGYDGVLDGEENHAVRDLTTASPSDPEGDDWGNVDERYREIDPRRYRRTNGSEGNKTLLPVPDTEDLNLNRILDQNEDFIRYTIDLGDTNYLVTDVQKEYPGLVASDNGWRRYRIPIGDTLAVRFGSPDLTLARQVRVWIEGIQDPDPPAPPNDAVDPAVRPLLVLGSLDIVGSRWQASDLTSTARLAGTTMTLNSVNSVDNADVYVPPFDPGQTRNGSQELTRREQSLALEFTELQPGDTLEAFKTFSINEDYSRYGALDWYAAAFQVPGYVAGVDSLDYFVRFASDELGRNYYEYRTRMPASSARRAIQWREVHLALTALSNLKLAPGFPKADPILYQAPGANPGEEYTVHGHPSFTRIRRISFGIINRSSRSYPEGQLWFDELRATDVAKDVGRAQRVLVNGRFANLLSYNMAWNGRDANFITVGQSRGTGNTTNQFSFATSLDLHRFYEATGIVTPVSFSYTRSTSTPRFTAGDDVVRTGPLAAASQSVTETRTVSTSYSRQWSDRANPLLRYTLGGLTGSIRRSETLGHNPSTKDSSVSLSANVNYGISPRRLLALGLPHTKLKLYPLPERFYWNYSIATVHSQTYDRLRDSTLSLRPREPISGRSAFIDFGADTRPIDAFHHHFEARRNLTLDEPLREQFGFVNLGKVVRWMQNMDTRYTLNRGTWLKPSFSWNSRYSQNNGPELSSDLSVRQVSNGQSATMNWDLPFDRLARLQVPSDTTRHASSFAWREWLSHIGALGWDASFSKSSSYSRIMGTPNMLYLLGLSSDAGLSTDNTARVRAAFGNDATDGLDWRSGARTRVTLPFGATMQTRFDLSAHRANTNGVINRTVSLKFPDFDLDYGHLAQAIHLDRWLVNPRLRTAYNRSQLKSYYNNSVEPSGISRSSEWRPLLGVQGDLKNGARTELRVERRVTQTENTLLGNSVTTDRNTAVNFSITRSYSQGQKVTFLGKETTVRSSISLGLSAVYSRRSGETIDHRFERPQQVVQRDRLSVNGTGSYSFSTNVTGNVAIGFGQDRDLQLHLVSRSVRVEVRAQFTF